MVLTTFITSLTPTCTSIHPSRWSQETATLPQHNSTWYHISNSRRHRPHQQLIILPSVWSKRLHSNNSSSLAVPFTRQDTARPKDHLAGISSTFHLTMKTTSMESRTPYSMLPRYPQSHPYHSYSSNLQIWRLGATYQEQALQMDCNQFKLRLQLSIKLVEWLRVLASRQLQQYHLITHLKYCKPLLQATTGALTLSSRPKIKERP